MRTRILLVNFSDGEKKEISKLGIDIDLGYLSNPINSINHDGSIEAEAAFYSPLAIYDYKAIFIKLTKNPPLEGELKDKAKIIGDDSKTFYKYWFDKKGILTLFAEESGFNKLTKLGIPVATLRTSRGNDKEIFYTQKENSDKYLRNVLRETKSLIVIPPPKYVNVSRYETEGENRWTIFPVFRNRNDEEIGIYLNWGFSFSDVDNPALIILPQYENYEIVIVKLLKAYAKIFKESFSEIIDTDWTNRDDYYPDKIKEISNEIEVLEQETIKKIEILNLKKTRLKKNYSYLADLLTETGDKLKKSVIKTLIGIFQLQAKDADSSKKTDLKEDILIEGNSASPILAEVKGTRQSYPSFTYVSQVFNNLYKQRDKYPNAIGGLILNLDWDKEPSERSDAYTKADEEKQLENIVYVDTRVLYNLSLAVINGNLSATEAKNILLAKGRVKFNLKSYLRGRDNKKNNLGGR